MFNRRFLALLLALVLASGAAWASGGNGGQSIVAIQNTDGSLTLSSSNGTVTISRQAITGDISIPLGSNVSTLATVNSNIGSYTCSNITVNAKGLVTAAASGSCSGGSGNLTVGTSTISGGTSGKIEYNNAGVLGEYAISGTGNVAMTANPTFTGTVTGASSLWSNVEKINLNASSLPAAQIGTVLQIGNADSTATRIEADSFGASGYHTSVRKDGTNASPTTLQSGDEIGGFNAFGYNGTSVVGPQASFRTFAAQNWSVGSNGSYADIAGTPNGSSTLTEVAYFGPTTVSGALGVGIGTSSPADTLDMSQKTDAITLPSGTSSQRPSGVAGMVRYNSTATPGLEAFVNGQWVSLTGVPNVTYSGTHTLNQGDTNGQVNVTGTWTLTIPSISSTILPANNYVCLNNEGSGTITVSSTPTINLYSGGTTSVSLGSGQLLCLLSNGSSLDASLAAASGGGMTYPSAGIANSTGSAWGTSYSVSGTGSVALTASPTFTGTVGAAAITATGIVTGEAFISPPNTITYSSGFTPVAVTSNTYRVVLIHADCNPSACSIVNPSGSAVDGQKFILEIWQSSTGSDTVSFGNAYDFGTAGAPTLSTGANKGDFLGFAYSAQNSKYNYIGVSQGF